MRFHFPNEEEIVLEGYNSIRRNPIISNIKVNKIMFKGLLCHLVSVNDFDHDIPSIDSVPLDRISKMYFLIICLEFPAPLERLTFVCT